MCVCGHPQNDCFSLSELFSQVRHVGRLKPGSKPIQLFVGLSIRQLGQQANHFGKCNYKVFLVVTAAAASVSLKFYTRWN